MAFGARPIVLGMATLAAVALDPFAGWSQNIPNPDLKSISPVFEGWQKNEDGTYTLYFGYFNRNADEVTVPIGPNNNISPEPADRNQPTNFLPGRDRNTFEIQVPAGWNSKIVWTLEVNGARMTANGTTVDLHEVAKTRPGNAPPTIKADEAELSATVNAPVPMTATAGDDAHEWQHGQSSLTVNWSKYRGPASKIVFETDRVSMREGGGQARTTARFTAPGAYVVRVLANDGRMSAADWVTVAVK